jgi:hypothetical protein
MYRWEKVPLCLVAVFFYTCRPCCTFTVRRLLQTAPSSPTCSSSSRRPQRLHRLHESSSSPRDDPVRSSNRASLHPLTINILSDLLQLRAQGDAPPFVNVVAEKNATISSSSSTVVTPLELAIGVSRMAVEKLTTRQELSNVDGMSLTPEEQQTVAGRVVGVTMRLAMLEADLEQCCASTAWVAKYNEWERFGVVGSSSNQVEVDTTTTTTITTQKLLLVDGLFRLNRAECLLALFLHRIERPELAKKAVSVPDNSTIDFIDIDRLQVLKIM